MLDEYRYRHLWKMAIADGDYADAEQRALARIAAAFAVTDDELRLLTAQFAQP